MNMRRFGLGVLLTLIAQTGVATDEAPLVCAGGDAWRLEIDAGTALFSRQLGGMGAAQWRLVGRATGTPETGLVWRGRADGGEADLVAFLTPADGHLNANLALPDGSALVGRCDPTVPVARAPEPPPWWDRVRELMPALNACLARSSGENVRVTKAWWRDDGQIGMRTRNIYMGWWDCVASADGSEVSYFAPLPQDALQLPGEGLVVFTGVANRQPPGACYQNHQPVESDDGALLGWMSDLIC
ncbi:MAG: hypothetical protein H6926_06055 [Chromatiales bacterium]|nr:hypothetical protein [Gammaproteobacteria bacterium]MCP5352733.1 hypothetical protein [Chromatiales bacterium]